MTVAVREYTLKDYEVCRHLWVELTQHHREIYDDATIAVTTLVRASTPTSTSLNAWARG